MRFWRICLASTALVPMTGQPLWANPLDGKVVQGQAIIQGVGTKDVTVTQHTDRAAIEWKSFNIEKGERTRFVQPSDKSVILNRVTGSQAASRIYGTLESNGTVYLVNPDGVLFGPSAVVNTGSLLATTHNITDTDFMAGRDRFSLTTGAQASVVNEGMISVRDGGFAALVAPGVRNDGIITAKYGSIGMSAVGSQFYLDLRGDELINFAVSDEIAGEVKDVRTGEALPSLVENKGKLKADGGRVALTAATARKVVDSVINTSGVIEANTISSKGGQIILGAATSGTKADTPARQLVKASGTLSAAGKRSGEKGGTVQITGEAVELERAKIDASGNAGGGKILVGGDYKGGDRTANPLAPYENYLIPTADYLVVDQSSRLTASATQSGDGGKVILWGNRANYFSGDVLANGGVTGGDGGFVEVSSPFNLQFWGNVDTLAPKGVAGQLLLDPHSLIIGEVDSPNPNMSGGVSGGSNSLIPNLYDPNTTAYLSASRIEQMMLTNSYVWIFLTSNYGKVGSVHINSDIVAPANDSYLEILSYSDFTMDVYLNATVDFSKSTGFFGIGLSGTTPANAIYAGPNGKIIANAANLNLSAKTVGTSANPIPVQIVPDDDATQQNYVYCANWGVCSDTGTRINVLDEYANDAEEFRDNVFVSVTLRADQSIIPPTTPTDPEPPVVEPPVDPETPITEPPNPSRPETPPAPTEQSQIGQAKDEMAQNLSVLAELERTADKLRERRASNQQSIEGFSSLADLLTSLPSSPGSAIEFFLNWALNWTVNEVASTGMGTSDFAERANAIADSSSSASYNPDRAAESIEMYKKLGIEHY